MKVKSIIAAALICALFNTCVYAEALRKDPLLIQAANRPAAEENDLLFDDFSGDMPGSVPSSVRSTGGSGTLFLTTDEVSEGFKKNCLVFTDTVDSGGPQAQISVPETGGIVTVETRYKYTSTGNPWSVFRLTLHGYDDGGTLRDFSWMSVQSGNGYHYYNNGGAAQTQLTAEAVKDGVWYNVKMSVDFENSVIYTAFTDESTDKTTYALEKGFYYSDFTPDALAQVNISCTVGTGKWTVDYIRVSKENELPAFADTDIPKGTEAKKVAGASNHALPDRININLDGKYKYLSIKPYISESGSVMATLKNIAAIFGFGYIRRGDEFTLKNGDEAYIFKAGEDSFLSGGSSVPLGESSALEAYQLFVPIMPVAEFLGYEVSFDEENQCVNIISPSENGGGQLEN